MDRAIDQTLARLLNSSPPDESLEPLKCKRCRDTQSVIRIVEGGRTAADVCICARRASRRARLSPEIVPPKFNQPRLYRLKADPRRHQNQARAIVLMQQKPEISYLLLGKQGTGKTHLTMALYRHAVYQSRPTVICLLRELLEDYRRVEVGGTDGEIPREPRIVTAKLKKPGPRWFICLQEFDKGRASEFASEALFTMLDTARDYEHQLVITSNFTAKELAAKWSKAEPSYGPSIMTRLQGCTEINFF